MDRDLLKSTVNFGFLACHENYIVFRTKTREYNNVITIKERKLLYHE